MPRKPTIKTVTFADGSRSVFNKNGNGEGTVYFQASKNAWRASYLLEGEAVRRYVQARTRDQVVVKRDQAMLAASITSKSARFSTRTTVAEFGAWWLDNEARHRVRSSSLDQMQQRLTRLGSIGQRALSDVNVEDLITWQSELLKSYAPKTVADSRTTARQVFAAAVELNLIASNPAERLKPPKVVKRPGRTLTIEEVGTLLDATDDHRYGAVVRILFTTGLRVSEALGLSWDDIDLDTGRATVRRAVTYSVAHGTALGPPKTEGATGVHHLAPGAMAKLLAWRQRQADERRAAGSLWREHQYEGKKVALVFTTESGGLVSRQHVDALLRRSAVKAGIDPTHLGTHVGRRTVVTTLYTNGAELADIARHVGHSNTSTTAGYVSSLGDRPERTASLAASLLDRSIAGAEQTTTDRPPTNREHL